ncbi:FAD-binding PCMH-type domain-containing protein [Fusarium keratoplasticum]|uniref:FAD-binding PCMH-type domain-containing protein n=1 Tax=Fusarium keratoplasticum TaxID=1328300 RepID=A0ACC0R819_9HYPO|nr:FAD-binding PCMH-type domain-containing protein [Fusarium keratoplasticum]KAI8664502.1 FAD-binding PCMH-type domain-containing protein [Fusarium keratoplasticum]KAI8675877.1 FAD-binding PCMH-type domain-containing protein [Fusarium keratoplasticum]
MAQIQDFQGMQYSRDGPSSEKLDYGYFNQQYASSSYQQERDLNPAMIIQPKGDEDVIGAVNWARQNKVAIAVKSGGHQYSGACSTGGKNIQIDLSNTYKDMKVLNPKVPVAEDRALVFVGVSNQLKDFNAYLRHNGLFVPHGQCAYVCVGGHGQTGGYGQLGRSFGLFGDHVRTIRMVCHDGVIREITKDSDAELFHAILGGSPGNFGIITHYIVEVFQGKSYIGTVAGPNGIKGPHGMKALYLYNPDVLKKLLTEVAKMGDNAKFPQGFDLCVSVLSTDFPVTMLFPSLKDASLWEKIQNKIKEALADDVLDLLNGAFPAIIVVYAQWCPVNKADKYDKSVDAWFQKFRDLKHSFKLHTLRIEESEADEDMSKMTGRWIFPKQREFDLPYVKRTYATNSRTLEKDGWVDSVVKRLDLIYNPRQKLGHNKGEDEYEVYTHCKLSVQIQCFGGDNSRFYTDRNNGTSYSWRDSSVVQTLDCFHDPGDKYKKYALNWQKENDAIMVGRSSPFSKQDKRVLWGSYGDWDLGKPEIWKCYYEDEQKYQRLGKARGKADPNGTFTANPFAVKAIKET